VLPREEARQVMRVARINASALKTLVRDAVALNKSKAKR
jgi:hypothetical protein